MRARCSRHQRQCAGLAIAILGPTGSGKSALAMRIGAARAGGDHQRRFGAGVSRPGYRHGQARPRPNARAFRITSSTSAIRSRSIRPANFAPTVAAADRRDHRARARAAAGGWHDAVFPRAVPRHRRAAAAQIRSCARHIDARARARGLARAACGTGRARSGGAARIHPNDAQRIQRALEVLALSGRTPDEHWRAQRTCRAPMRLGVLFLEPDNRAAAACSALRSAWMRCWRQDLPAKWTDCWARGTLDEHSPAMRLVGYRQLIRYCRGSGIPGEAAARALVRYPSAGQAAADLAASDQTVASRRQTVEGRPF